MRLLPIAVITAALLGAGSVLAADAKPNWDKHCLKCHGADGKGQTTMGKKLKVKDYTDAEVQKKFKDEDILKIVKEGKKEGDKTLMKAFKDELSEQAIKDLAAYVRKFAAK